jgi:hypothetical protein
MDRNAIEAINQYCEGTDKVLAELLKKYAGGECRPRRMCGRQEPLLNYLPLTPHADTLQA